MTLFRVDNTEFDVGEYSHERILWLDVLVRGERMFSEPVQLTNQPYGKKLVELIRKSETTVEVVFNSQLHTPGHRYDHTVDLILRDEGTKAIASAFSVNIFKE